MSRPSASEPLLLRLPETLSALALSFLGAKEASSLSQVSSSFSTLAHSPELWYFLCSDTGKLETCGRPQSLLYRDFYISNPSIPHDCATLAGALDHVTSGGTIVVAGNQTLRESELVVARDCEIKVHPPLTTARVLSISRASGRQPRNKPLLSIKRDTTCKISNVSFQHVSSGEDIWKGNAAVFVDGGNLFLADCSVQSDTGRGIVSCNEGIVKARDTVVHDSAATGVYAGGKSVLTLDRCNVLRNGVGGAEIPAGHSGIYVESSKALISDCFVSANSLTGVTLVRGGDAVIANSDVVENGSDAFTIEDEATMGSTVQLVENNLDGVSSRATTEPQARGLRATFMGHYCADDGEWRKDEGWDFEAGGGQTGQTAEGSDAASESSGPDSSSPGL
ncbi:hypothetical protein TeGR_g6709 [Tetraparma gracilis]|uniref:F-box domain-containing protein n=1 Tax=Tetraparma gracilis TaxID=2962635 RepID=A0ABQ6N2M7_9STRA|nr:hypothetical protein TeGR_g6709 [Tetraparma gracilis]